MPVILSVEDNQADQFLNREVIEKYFPGAEIAEAYDGEEALEYLKTCDTMPDIILLDINMPRMDGHEFLQEIAKSPAMEKPPVIMLTSSAHEDDKRSALSFDFVRDYWLKPMREENYPSLKKYLEKTH